MKMRVADYIIDRLATEGVKNIFQVTGRGSLFLNDAVAKSDEIKGISMHHEQACAFAAIAASEQEKNIGVCLVSTGCASTNTITGVLCAWQDGIPLLIISGQNFLRETRRFTKKSVRTFGQQEADIIELIEPITKYARMLQKAEDIVKILDEAIYEAKNGRKGPVFIDIPLDLQSSLIEIDPNLLGTKKYDYTSTLNTTDISKLTEMLGNSTRPTILIGKGVALSNTEIQLREFSEKHNIPVTYATSAPDTYGLKNINSIGSVGAMGCSRAGNFAIQNSDLILVLGSRLTALTTGPEFCKFGRDAKIIVVDIDPDEHSKEGVAIDLLIQADLKNFFSELSTLNFKNGFDKWLNQCLKWKELFSGIEKPFQSTNEIDLYQLCEALSKTVPDNTTILTDSGLNEVIIPSNMAFSDSVNCIHSASQGAMGFALPASIGAQFAKRHNLIVPIIGDGSIMMNLQELETIRSYDLPIKLIIINNNVYSIIRRRQKDLFRKRTIGTDPSNGVTVPDFSQVAACFGFEYIKIEHVGKLDQKLRTLFEMQSRVICEIIGREDQSYIELGFAKSDETKRFVRRPLEDQSPFLDRELIKREMVTKPIDM